MKLTETELKGLVTGAFEHGALPRECLSEELVLRAASGQLDRRERGKVASHLSICSDCVLAYRIAHDVRTWAEQTEIATAFEPSATVGHDTRGIRVLPTTPAENLRRQPLYRRTLPYALAASVIVLAVLGGSLAWLHRIDSRNAARLNTQLAERDQTIAELKQSVADAQKHVDSVLAQQGWPGPDVANEGTSDKARISALEGIVADLSKPQFDTPVIDIEPSRPRGDAGGSITTIEMSPSANVFTLILHTSGNLSNARYRLEILTAGGKLVFRGSGIKTTPENGLTVALSRRMIPAGRYTLRLYGLESNRTEHIEQYVVEVRYH